MKNRVWIGAEKTIIIARPFGIGKGVGAAGLEKLTIIKEFPAQYCGYFAGAKGTGWGCRGRPIRIGDDKAAARKER